MFSSTTSKRAASSHGFWLLPKLLRIVRDSVTQAEFAAICLLSRQIYARANPIIHERISLYMDGVEGNEMLFSLYQDFAVVWELSFFFFSDFLLVHSIIIAYPHLP